MASPADEYVPIINQPATMIACTTVFQIIATASVALRLHARFKIINGFGADDVFVLLSLVSTLIGNVIACLLTKYGMGKHMVDVPYRHIKIYLMYTWLNLLTQSVSASTIKISILLQYIRLAGDNYKVFRRISAVLVAFVSVWGLFYFFFTIFTCTPVDGFWRLEIPHQCFLYGSYDQAKYRYVTQAASNMALDCVIFLLPIILVRTVKVSRKSILGIIGVFSMGAIVVIISAIRLYSMVRHKMGLKETSTDGTWYASTTVLLASLEFNMAVITASIPIFWPMLKQFSFGRIVVVSEVSVRSEPRDLDKRFDDDVELTWRPPRSANGSEPGTIRSKEV